MKKTLSIAVLLAALGLATSAHAQVQAALNDLVLGFRATGGQGQTVNLEVNLGSVSQFTNLPAGTTINVSRLNVADLAATYGGTWNTRSDLFWGIVGTSGRVGSGGPNGAPLATLWATRAQDSFGTQSTPWARFSQNGQAAASANIEPLYTGAPGSLSGKTATTGNANAATVTASLAGSYSAQASVQPGTSFGFFNPSIDNTANIPSGRLAVSDLYELRPGTGAATYLGSFGLSATGTLTFSTSPSSFGQAPINPGRLVNLSVLTSVAAGESFTFGFVTGGDGTSGAKPVLARAMGPSLTQVGVTGVLADPRMTYFVGSTQTSTNDNWGGGAALAAQAAAVGAFPFASTGSLDAALSLTNVPSGNNSVVVAGTGSGTVLAELYDATPSGSFTASTPRLVNVSILKNIGNVLTMGFYVGGSTSKTVLIRAVGPTLAGAPFNVSGAIADPKLELFDGSQKSIATNDNWGGTASLTAAFSQVGAFALPASSRDAALVATLNPGSYTAQVTVATGTTGVALVEVYEVP